MANSKELFSELVNNIRLKESKDEVEGMVYLVLENQLGLSRTDVLAGGKVVGFDRDRLEEIVLRINHLEPIQYILGEAWFYGRKFKVNPSVLIPRPETELIVREVIKQGLGPHPLPSPRLPSALRQASQREWGLGGTIIDVGAGSGCLAITLAKELPAWEIHATDISKEALKTAAENAELHHVALHFYDHDILTEEFPVTGFDFIVSNPPYVTRSERNRMKKNVLDHEPELALFVPDDNPLIFHRAIAQQGKRILRRPGGRVILEINEKFGNEVKMLFSAEGYSAVVIGKDLAGKDRFVSATIV